MKVKKTIIYAVFSILVTVLWAVPGVAAQARLAVLVSSASQPYQETLKGLQRNLENSGTDVVFDVFHLDNESIKAQIILEELKAIMPNVIITLGSLAFNTVTAGINDIPIVAGMMLTKQKILQQQNATGVVLDIPIETQFAWLKKFFPLIQNVGVLYDPDQNEAFVQEAKSHALSKGLNLVALPVSSPRKLPAALRKIATKADILWGISDPVVLNKKTAKDILLFSFRNKTPFVGLSRTWVKAGAYYALDRDYHDIGAQCGEMVNEILHGKAVETIPPSFPRKINYSLNTRTARKMNMMIEQQLINNAQKVF